MFYHRSLYQSPMFQIHLDHYYDWTLLPPSSGSSGVSGLPSSSGSKESRLFPVFRSFAWCPGVLDGQSGARLVGPCMFHLCHRMPFQGRRDEEDDDQGMAHRDWRRNINARGRPSDDRLHAAANGVREHTRSPRARRHGGVADSGSDGRGCSLLRSPPVHRRNRQPPRRDDEGWERRRSRSPVGHTLCQDLFPVWSHGEQKEGDQTVLAGVQPTLRDALHAKDRTPHSAPAARSFSDPSLSFLPCLRDEDI
jgi:hypothetical protein